MRSIFNKLLLSFISIALAVATVLYFIFLNFIYDHQIEQVQDKLKTQAQLIIDRVGGMMGNPDIAKLDSIADRLGRQVGSRITLIMEDGLVVADSNKDPRKMDNHRNRSEIAAARESGFGSSIRFSNTVKKNLVYVALPIKQGTEISAVARTSFAVSDINEVMADVQVNLLIYISLVLFLISAAAVLFSRSISRPIDRINRMLSAIVSGNADLTKRMNLKRNDEIGQLAGFFDRFLDRLNTFVSLIKNNSTDVVDKANQFSDFYRTVDTTFSEIERKSTEVETLSNNLHSSISTVSKNSNVSMRQIEFSKDIAQQSLKKVGRLVNEYEQFVEQLFSMKHDISAFKESFSDLQKLSTDINDISDRINILSVNVQIEAAKLNETDEGGFKVIAEDMAKLSTRSIASIQKVQGSLGFLGKQIDTIVKHMNDSEAKLNQFRIQLDLSLNRLNDIESIATESTNLLEEISSQTSEQNHSSQEMYHNVSRLMDSIKTVKQDLIQSNQQLSKIFESSEELLGSVANFKLN